MQNWLSLLTGLVAGVLMLALYLVRRRAKKEKLADRLKIEMLESNYQTLLKMYEKKSILVHDMKNHIRIIAKMVKEGREEEAMDYLAQIAGEMQQCSGAFYTNHRMLDSVLNMKYQEAEQYGIKVQCQYDDMRGMKLSLVEICALFTNLLDNAIEANLNCPAGVERKIEMACRKHGKILVISVSNPIWETSNALWEEDSMSNQSVEDISVGDKPVTNRFMADISMGDKPVTNRFMADTSAGDNPVKNQSAGNTSSGNNSMGNHAAGNLSGRNRFPEKQAGSEGKRLFQTTKKAKDMHGFGMLSIQKVLDSHGGYMKTDIRERQFRIVVYLNAFQNG